MSASPRPLSDRAETAASLVPDEAFQVEVGIVRGTGQISAEHGVLGWFAMLGGVRSHRTGMEKEMESRDPSSREGI